MLAFTTAEPQQEKSLGRWRGRTRWKQWLSARSLLPVLVLMVAACVAGAVYARFLPEHRRLWSDVLHDRHAHLYSGLCIATDLRHGRFFQLISDFDKFRTWPPFHDGLLVGIALLLGDGDPRAAVFPSLLGWMGAAIFAFLLARRAAPQAGSVAGLLAALLVLVSPAHRAFATDVMLESVGACLTLMSLYFYVLAVQDRSVWSGRLFGLTLTALFLEKYNYWGLVALAVAAHQLTADPFGIWSAIRRKLTPYDLWGRLRRQCRAPWNYVLAAILIAIVAVTRSGGITLNFLGQRLTLHSPANLFTAAYYVFVLRLAVWYWRNGHSIVRQLAPVQRALVYWHAWPIALWFMWPGRFYCFAWVANPSSNAGEAPRHDWWSGYSYYWSCLWQDYHVGVWSVVAVLALTAIALWAGLHRRLRPGAAVILWLILIAFVSCAHHPNRKSRFLHSWLAAAWVGAGIGAAHLLRRSTRNEKTSVSLGRAAVALSIGTLAVAHLPAFGQEPHAPEGGLSASETSVLSITDSYLPYLTECRAAAVFSNMPLKFLAQWTYLERYGRAQRLETDIKGFYHGKSDNRGAFDQWLASTKCDAIVYVDIPPGSRLHMEVRGCEELDGYGELLASQCDFSRVHQQELPTLGCSVTVWKRVPCELQFLSERRPRLK